MNVPQDALLNYCMHAVSLAYWLTYAAGVFRRCRRGEFPLAGIVVCVAFFVLFGLSLLFGRGEEGGLTPFFATVALFIHAFVAERLAIRNDPVYKIEIFILTIIGIIIFHHITQVYEISHGANLSFNTLLIFFILWIPAYFIYLIICKNKNDNRYMMKVIMISSSISALINHPIIIMYAFFYIIIAPKFGIQL